MTRAEFEEKSFNEIMEVLENGRDDITTYENLKDFAIYNINNDTLSVAIHILESISKDY